MLAAAVARVMEDRGGRAGAAERAIVADIMRWTVPAPGGTIAG